GLEPALHAQHRGGRGHHLLPVRIRLVRSRLQRWRRRLHDGEPARRLSMRRTERNRRAPDEKTLTGSSDPWADVTATFQRWADAVIDRLQAEGGPKRPVP